MAHTQHFYFVTQEEAIQSVFMLSRFYWHLHVLYFMYICFTLNAASVVAYVSFRLPVRLDRHACDQ
jgi:hypothetical protein